MRQALLEKMQVTFPDFLEEHVARAASCCKTGIPFPNPHPVALSNPSQGLMPQFAFAFAMHLVTMHALLHLLHIQAQPSRRICSDSVACFHTQGDPEQAQASLLLNRRMRRKRSWLQAAAEVSSQQLAERLQGDDSSSASHQRNCRLETHLWHAKRFRMTHL